MPYMSPAAIGWMAVMPRGLPFSRKCFPMDRREASGHPKPLEELTVTTASSAISSPIFSIGIILDRNINGRDGFNDYRCEGPPLFWLVSWGSVVGPGFRFGCTLVAV